MTRADLDTLRQAMAALRADNKYLCLAYLRRLELAAEWEHAAEDRHHDAESIPINAHSIAAE